MLKAGAVEFVTHWKANPYTGPRTYPVLVNYVLDTVQKMTRNKGFSMFEHHTVRPPLPISLILQSIVDKNFLASSRTTS